jgi:hypothetical protein
VFNHNYKAQGIAAQGRGRGGAQTQMPMVRGPNRGCECAGIPGCCESAHQRSRAGQSRHHKRCTAVVKIAVAGIIIIVVVIVMVVVA